MKYFIFIISFFVVEALQASDERDNHSELLDAKAKLLDIGWAYQHHQSDFRIPEDCVGDDRCNKLLVEQNLNILQVFIMDSLKYLAPYINDNSRGMEFTYEEIGTKFSESEALYPQLSKIDCELAFHCFLGSYCGRGDYGIYPSCIADSKSKRIEYLSAVINNGFAHQLQVIKPNLTLETDSFLVNISGACILPAKECNDLKYFGKSKNNGASISLTGVPFYGRDKNTNNVKFLGYFFKNHSVEYYVSLAGNLKVHNLKNDTTLLEESGVWKITP